MPLFSRGIPRLAVLVAAAAVFALLTPETFARGPALCLWSHLFHLSACPACGTLRALAAVFHGRFAEALAFNRNVVVTAPTLTAFVLSDSHRTLKKLLAS